MATIPTHRVVAIVEESREFSFLQARKSETREGLAFVKCFG
jgi:hypothetical protein